MESTLPPRALGFNHECRSVEREVKAGEILEAALLPAAPFEPRLGVGPLAVHPELELEPRDHFPDPLPGEPDARLEPRRPVEVEGVAVLAHRGNDDGTG